MTATAQREPLVAVLDEVTHTYTVRGAPVPGVTSILDGVLKEFAHIDRETLRRAQERGTAVHKACELYVLGTLDYATLDPALVPYLEAFIRFLGETGFVPQHCETVIYSERYGYAGKLDLLGKADRQQFRWLVDIKTPETLPKSVGPQSAAYEQAAHETGLVDLARERIERKALQLFNDGTYTLQALNDKSDLNIFLAALTIQRFQQRRFK